MNMTNTVTSKGTTTIPKAVREDLNIRQGDQIRFVKSGKASYRIEKELNFEDLRMLNAKYMKKSAKKMSLEEISEQVDRGMAEETAARYKRPSE